MEIEVSGSPPVLVSVTNLAAESCPMTVLGNSSADGVTVSVAVDNPVPLSATVCVPLVSVKVSEPVAAPTCVGVKVSIRLQEPSAGIKLPQELVAMEKGPLRALVKLSAGEPLLLAVT